MTQPLDGCLFRAASSGSGAFVVDTVVTGWLSPTGANAVDGMTLHYRAQNASNLEWEIGSGIWTAATTTLTRVSVYYNSSTTGLNQGGAGTTISFAAAPQVGIVVLAQDLRETLTSDRVYYVNNVTGSDLKTGLTTGTALATIQHAANIISDRLYLQNATPSIQCVTTGVDYNEWVDLRPWQGSITGAGGTTGYEGCITIKGDATDGSLVKIKPVGTQPTSYGVYAAVQARGVGSWWSLVDITVDGSGATGQTGQSCEYALDGAKMYKKGGGLGGVTDFFGTGFPQIGADNNALFRWDAGSAGSSHVFGTATGGMLALSDHNSEVVINNTAVVWDNDPGYFAVLFSAVNSKIMYYHNFAFSGTALVGCYKFFLQDNCEGSASLALSALPGDTAGAVDPTSRWRGASGALVKSGAAAATDLPVSTSLVVHDTLGGTTKLCYNDAGTLRTVALI